MKTAFVTFFTAPMLIGLIIVIASVVGCSSTNQMISTTDMVVSISSTPEASITTTDGDNASSHAEIVANVLEPRSSDERIETITTEEEVLADLLTFDRVYQNLDL